MNTLPVYGWQQAPDGLLTRTQLRKAGLRPNGHDVVAEIRWRSRKSKTPRVAYLYPVDQAAPVRPMTAAKQAALDAANRARRICPDCGRDAGYVLPARYGCCLPCSGTLTQLDQAA